MNKASEQNTTSGAAQVCYQRQKRPLSSSEPTSSKSESTHDSMPLVHAFTLHARPKSAIKVLSTPSSATDAVSIVIAK